jgi:hypothetical protein
LSVGTSRSNRLLTDELPHREADEADQPSRESPLQLVIQLGLGLLARGDRRGVFQDRTRPGPSRGPRRRGEVEAREGDDAGSGERFHMGGPQSSQAALKFAPPGVNPLGFAADSCWDGVPVCRTNATEIDPIP